MSTFKYQNYRTESGNGTMNWPSLNVKLALVSAAYAADDSHVYLSEVPGVLAISGAFTGLAIVGGFAIGACPEFLLLRNDSEVAGAILFDDTGVTSTSRLIAFSNDGPGFPFKPVGFNYTITYNAIDGGWFQT